MARRSIILAAALLLLQGAAFAQHAGHHQPARQCDGALACANAATPFFAADGTLWLTWSAAGRVWVARSTDGGASLTPAVAVTPAAALIDDAGEARPKVVVDRNGTVVVTYTARHEKGYSGTLMLARSTDNGATFSSPRALASDPTSQRFEQPVLTADGRLALVWIDKRGITAAKQAGHDYAGAALAAAWSDDGAVTFSSDKVALDHSCECCRLATAAKPDGSILVMWRHVFPGGIRDHALTTLRRDGSVTGVTKVAEDNWKIDACPHHGPALALAGDSTVLAAWYTDGKARKGLFLARSTDGGATFSAPAPLGAADRAPSHAQLLAAGGAVWAAWKEFDGEQTTIAAMVSRDGGATWSPPRPVAATADASDHPLLVADAKGRPLLSWLTRTEGWRLLPMETQP
ncbi:MAG: sialidase family protein [Solirubrobacterales bacterium]